MSSKDIKYEFNKTNYAKAAINKEINRGIFYAAGNVLVNLLILFIISVFIPNNPILPGIIVSLIFWILVYDFFLSKRLKKGLSVLLSARRAITGRTYVINVTSIIGVTVGSSFILFLILTQYINWHDFFSFENLSNSDFNKAVFLVYIVLSFRVLFLLMGAIINRKKLLLAYDQLNFISALLTLIIIFFLSLEMNGYLTYFRIAIYSAPIVLFFFSISILLRQKIKNIQPLKLD